MRKPTIAGMHLWSVQVEFSSYLNRKQSRTLIIATRRHVLLDAQRKATTYLKANRSDYPKAQITGIQNGGHVDA